MFLIGYNMYGNQPFDANLSSYDFTYFQLTNIIADECSADLGNKTFSTEKGEWLSNTAFLATFNGTLEAGNFSMGDMEVDTVRFKKRKRGELKWLLFDEVPYQKTQYLYETKDRLARASIDYEYAVIPVASDIEGNIISNFITAEHDGLWVVDRNNSVNVFCEVDYGTIQHSTNIASFELLDSKYPIVVSGELDYINGSISGRLLSSDSLYGNSLNVQSEVTMREIAFEFMKNGKPKIIKNDKGRYYLVTITNVKEKPYSLNNASITISFGYVEIGDAEDLQTLIDCDLLPEQLNEVE